MDGTAGESGLVRHTRVASDQRKKYLVYITLFKIWPVLALGARGKRVPCWAALTGGMEAVIAGLNGIPDAGKPGKALTFRQFNSVAALLRQRRRAAGTDRRRTPLSQSRYNAQWYYTKLKDHCR